MCVGAIQRFEKGVGAVESPPPVCVSLSTNQVYRETYGIESVSSTLEQELVRASPRCRRATACAGRYGPPCRSTRYSRQCLILK